MNEKELEEKFGNDIYAAKAYLDSILPERPAQPKSPQIKEKTHSAAIVYAGEMELYERDLKAYKSHRSDYTTAAQMNQGIMEAYVKLISGFYNIPEKAQEKVWSKAYSDGHGEGYPGIYRELEELVELFS